MWVKRYRRLHLAEKLVFWGAARLKPSLRRRIGEGCNRSNGVEPLSGFCQVFGVSGLCKLAVAVFKQAAEACRYALVSTWTDDSSGRSGGRAFPPGLLLQSGSRQLLSSGIHFRRGL